MATPETRTLHIRGMHGAGCVGRVEAATGDRGRMMGVVFIVWLCTLPLVVLLAAPGLGAGGAAGVAVAVLAVIVRGCWVLCAWSRGRWHTAQKGDVR